jgi:hypothetical protein
MHNVRRASNFDFDHSCTVCDIADNARSSRDFQDGGGVPETHCPLFLLLIMCERQCFRKSGFCPVLRLPLNQFSRIE